MTTPVQVLATRIGGGLEEWIAKQAKVSGDVVWIELRHIALNEGQNRVQRWRASEELGEVVREIWSAAQQWSDSVGAGSQRFCICLLDQVEAVVAQFMTRVGSEAVGGHAWDSEPANLEGVTKQLMRHTEAGVKLAVGSAQEALDRLTNENIKLVERVERYEARHLSHLQAYEDLMTQVHTRALDADTQRRHEGRKDALLGKLALLIPILTAKWMGQVAPDPIVKAFAQSIEGDQLQRMAVVLKPEQQLALVSLLELHAEAESDGSTPAAEPEAPPATEAEAPPATEAEAPPATDGAAAFEKAAMDAAATAATPHIAPTVDGAAGPGAAPGAPPPARRVSARAGDGAAAPGE